MHFRQQQVANFQRVARHRSPLAQEKRAVQKKIQAMKRKLTVKRAGNLNDGSPRGLRASPLHEAEFPIMRAAHEQHEQQRPARVSILPEDDVQVTEGRCAWMEIY